MVTDFPHQQYYPGSKHVVTSQGPYFNIFQKLGITSVKSMWRSITVASLKLILLLALVFLLFSHSHVNFSYCFELAHSSCFVGEKLLRFKINNPRCQLVCLSATRTCWTYPISLIWITNEFTSISVCIIYIMGLYLNRLDL